MLKTLAILAALTMAAPALADGPVTGGGGEPSCGNDGSPPCAKPDLPNLQNIVIGGFNYGSYNAGTDRSGYMSNTIGNPPGYGLTYWAYHADQLPHAMDGSTVALGLPTSNVSFALNENGPPDQFSVAVTAQNSADGSAGAGLTLGYYIQLIAADATEAAKLDAVLAAGARARAQGKFMLELNGEGQADVSAATGQYTFGQTYRMAAHCWNTNGYVDTTGCGTHNYELFVDFVRGDTFEDGYNFEYYADVTISASTFGSATNYSGKAFIDPVIVFGSQFRGINFTAQGSGAPIALAFVPSRRAGRC